MPNGHGAVATGAVSHGLAERISHGKPKGYNVNKSMARTAQGMRERGMSVPSRVKVRETHKNFVAAGKRVSKRRGKRKAA